MQAVLVVLGLAATVLLVRALTGNSPGEFRKLLDDLVDFRPQRTLMGVDGRSALAIDEHAGRIALLARIDDTIDVRCFGFDALESCEVHENGEPLGMARRGDVDVQGDVVLEIPAPVSGASADIAEAERCWLVDLVVAVRSSPPLVHRVRLLREDLFHRSVRKGSALHRNVLLQAQEWYGTCRAIMGWRASHPRHLADEPRAEREAVSALAALSGRLLPVVGASSGAHTQAETPR